MGAIHINIDAMKNFLITPAICASNLQRNKTRCCERLSHQAHETEMFVKANDEYPYVSLEVYKTYAMRFNSICNPEAQIPYG